MQVWKAYTIGDGVVMLKLMMLSILIHVNSNEQVLWKVAIDGHLHARASTCWSVCTRLLHQVVIEYGFWVVVLLSVANDQTDSSEDCMESKWRMECISLSISARSPDVERRGQNSRTSWNVSLQRKFQRKAIIWWMNTIHKKLLFTIVTCNELSLMSAQGRIYRGDYL